MILLLFGLIAALDYGYSTYILANCLYNNITVQYVEMKDLLGTYKQKPSPTTPVPNWSTISFEIYNLGLEDAIQGNATFNMLDAAGKPVGGGAFFDFEFAPFGINDAAGGTNWVGHEVAVIGASPSSIENTFWPTTCLWLVQPGQTMDCFYHTEALVKKCPPINSATKKTTATKVALKGASKVVFAPRVIKSLN